MLRGCEKEGGKKRRNKLKSSELAGSKKASSLLNLKSVLWPAMEISPSSSRADITQ
jgi:hypothetical protein